MTGGANILNTNDHAHKIEKWARKTNYCQTTNLYSNGMPLDIEA